MLRVPLWRRTGRVGPAINALILLAIALVAAMTWRAVSGGADPAAAAEQTATVDTGNVTATVSASGNVEAASTVEASFEGAGGTLTHVYVKKGDRVREGQLLASIDRTSALQDLTLAQAQLQSAQASYAAVADGRTSAEVAQDNLSVASAQQSVRSAQTSLAQSRASYALTKRQQDAAVARAERQLADATGAEAKSAARQALVQAREQRATSLLQARQQVTQQEEQVASARLQLRSTQAQVAVSAQGATDDELANARSQVTSAQVGVQQAQQALDQTVLRAPAAGTVTAVNGTVGGSSSGSGSADAASDSGSSGLVTITATGTLEVTAYVAEADIGDVEVGQTATVTLSASDTEVTGTVTSVDTVETVTNNVVEYGVTVRLDKTKGVRLGATSQLTVNTGEKENVTRVSSSALTTIGDRTTATVLQDDGTTQTVQVEVGLQGDTTTEVLSGLSPGDTVVLPEQTDSATDGFSFPAGGPGGAVISGPGR
jgi:multidrug efflux pump subunit AcrA (membrane-fusion protein)